MTGGSALPKTVPVVGLLFGYYSNENSGGGSGKFLCCLFLDRCGGIVLFIKRNWFICLVHFSYCVDLYLYG